MSKDISVIIHTRNEEENIEQCIRSAQLLIDEIIVVDMESEDKTKEIAKRLNAKVYTFPKSDYVEPARKFGIEKAKTDWVFFLDADERITEELAREVRQKIEDGRWKIDNVTHYKIPRKNIFGKVKWLRYGGWWPDYQIRLIKKDAFSDWPKEIHSIPKIVGRGGSLKNPIVHYFHGDLEKMVEKTAVFEDIESNLLFKAGRTVNVFTFFRKFLGELYRRLCKYLGFLDGSFGIIEAIYQAFSKTITYIFLYEKKLKGGSL